MIDPRLAYLLAEYRAHTISTTELEELELIFEAKGPASRALLLEADTLHLFEEIPEINAPVAAPRVTVVRAMPLRRQWLYAAAAVLVTLMAGSAYFLMHQRTPKGAVATVKTKPVDIAPGTQKATLTLADGAVIELDKTREGELAKQGSTTIHSFKGEVAYSNNQRDQTGGAAVLKNTLTTPNGGEFKLVLPDGSHVWLNAASSLRFPSRFNGNTREVELIGEAYFEIAQHATMPFFVKTPTNTIEVLGTHFNVNAYADESSHKTTLLEGSIRVVPPVISHLSSVILKPGQQASTTAGATRVKQVDAEATVAWMQGLFSFENITVPELMRQISRWYNIEVTYEGPMPTATYVIRFSRNLELATALEILEKVNIHTRIINNRQIAVLP